MSVQFAPKQGSFGQTLGNAVGGGLNRLIEGKLEQLNKEQKVQDARKWVGEAGLPEWLGDAFVGDPKTFQKFIEQWEFLPPEAQEQVREATSNVGVEDESQSAQNPQQAAMMQAEQYPTPMGQQAPAGVQVPAEDMGRNEQTMSGLNKISQAGQGYQRPVDEGTQQAQSFPALGHGTQGQAAPFESQQPTFPEWTDAEKSRGWRPKTKAVGSKNSGATTTLAQQKYDLSIKKQEESKRHVQEAYDRVKEILDTGYTGYSLTGWTPEGRKQRNELDTLSEVFISNLIPLLNPKGTISKERFNYIKNLAPNAWDTDATIKGKMAALKEIFDLKGSSPEKSSKGTVEMRDASGAIYDIPEDQVEKAKKGGLK